MPGQIVQQFFWQRRVCCGHLHFLPPLPIINFFFWLPQVLLVGLHGMPSHSKVSPPDHELQRRGAHHNVGGLRAPAIQLSRAPSCAPPRTCTFLNITRAFLAHSSVPSTRPVVHGLPKVW